MTIDQRSNVPLISPLERPDSVVVIFDGNCRFCTSQVERLARLDTKERLSFLSLEDEETERRYPHLSREQLMAEMYVIDRQGIEYRGAEAFRHLSRILPRLWPMAIFLHLPFSLPLWNWLYRQIAHRRYWFGRARTCRDGDCRIRSQ